MPREKEAVTGIAGLTVAELGKLERPTLGQGSPVIAFRAVRHRAIGTMAGSGLSAAIYLAGKDLGQLLNINSLEELSRRFSELRLGILTVTQQNEGKISFDLTESLSCSGIHAVGEPLGHFEAGVIAGALTYLLKIKVQVKETACWGLGQDICHLEAAILP